MVAVPISSYGGTSIGYAGGVDEQAWAFIAPHLGAEYGVKGADDWRVTTVTEAILTLRIAAGTGFGYGVFDTTTAPAFVSIPGAGWWLVVARRNWSGASGATEFDVIAATTAGDIPARAHTPGSLDEQPLALVHVASGASIPDNIIDLRVWQANGGAVAASTKVLQFLDPPGTTVQINGEQWQRTMSTTGVAGWSRSRTDRIKLRAWGQHLSNGVGPSGDVDFEMQAGWASIATDTGGVFSLPFTQAFPSGLLSFVPGLISGVGAAAPGSYFVDIYDKSSTDGGRHPSKSGIWGRVFHPLQLDGVPNAAFRLSYIAIGW